MERARAKRVGKPVAEEVHFYGLWVATGASDLCLNKGCVVRNKAFPNREIESLFAPVPRAVLFRA